jgi:hypothetical protein
MTPRYRIWRKPALLGLVFVLATLCFYGFHVGGAIGGFIAVSFLCAVLFVYGAAKASNRN